MVVVLALALTLVAPSAAVADKPVREVLPLPPDATVDACGFPVLIHTEGQIIRNTWFDDEGNPVRAVETYPGLRYVLTNVATQRQITVSIMGPALYEFNADGSTTVTGSGPWGWWPANPGTGEPGIFLIRGRLTFTFDDEGNFSFRLLTGQIDNLCPRLG
jgi:hypothetical protein